MATSEAPMDAAGAALSTAAEGTPTVLHSEHYNSALQRALVEVDQVDAQEILGTSAAEAAYQHLTEQPGWNGKGGTDERLRRVAELFRSSGLGELKTGTLGPEGGEAVVAGSHIALAWRTRYGRAEKPVCAVSAGVLAGALAAVHDRAFAVQETHCTARGAPECRFRLTPVGEPVALYPEVIYPVPPSLLAPEYAPPRIDEAEVLEAVFGTRFPGEADPPPRLAGVPLTRLWADHYNRVSYRFEQQVPRLLGAKFAKLASIVLTEAGHVCAFHTFGGLLVSEVWDERVRPLLQSREEWAHALVTVINALGWGTWRIEALVPGERLIIRVYDSYEATGYRRHFGRATSPKCYLSRGVSAALMNLLYLGDIGARPELTPSLYNDLFRTPLSFRALETRCRAMEDPFCEFVVNPLSPSLGRLFSA